MKVLVVNCGSSSVKYTLYQIDNEKMLAKGLVECIGLPEAYFKQETITGVDTKEPCQTKNHMEAVELIINKLLAAGPKVIKDISEITAIGHRIVHGGDKFSDSVLVNPEVMKGLRECFQIAPLHTPAHYAGIEACQKILPGVPQVLVFDTAFHQTIPQHVYLYPLPYTLYEKYHIRRYGFHGTSHKYVSQKAAEMLGKPIDKLKLITCHLGNGCSVTAVEGGKSIDTSMGFTPLEGLMMGTRCGDIDPAIIVHLMTNENISAEDLNNLMNKKSGLLGISGLTNDMRTIVKAIASGSEKAKLAFDMFCYRIKKYISYYYGILNGADAIVFTAGIGENSPSVREASLRNLENLGIILDKGANLNIKSEAKDISSAASRVKILVIPTNEELMISRETIRVLTK